VQQAALQRHLSRIALECADHIRLRHYFWDVQPECLSATCYGLPGYIKKVRGRHRRRALTELRTGMHWGAEEQGRQTRTSREQRQCQHCQRLDGPGGIEDVRHVLFVYPLYREERLRWPELFIGFQRPAKEASLNNGPDGRAGRPPSHPNPCPQHSFGSSWPTTVDYATHAADGVRQAQLLQ
jgi:hypothetical protein